MRGFQEVTVRAPHMVLVRIEGQLHKEGCSKGGRALPSVVLQLSGFQVRPLVMEHKVTRFGAKFSRQPMLRTHREF